MIYKLFCCLAVKGPGLTDTGREILVKTASEMFFSEENKRKFREDAAEGVLEADFEVGVMVFLTGIIFRATIETDRGKSKVNFLLQPQKKMPTNLFYISRNPHQARDCAQNAHHN